VRELTILDEHRFPSHWSVQTFRWIIENLKVNTTENLPLLGANIHLGVTERFEGDGRAPASEDLSKYKKVEPGDIIMNPLGKPHGSIGRSEFFGITSPAYWVLRLKKTENDSRYFHYLLRSEFMIKEFIRRSKNLPPNQFDLSWENFRDISIALPRIEEQRRIADFLDAQIGKANFLIEKRNQQIASINQAIQSQLADIFLNGSGEKIPLKRLIKNERLGIWGEDAGEAPFQVVVARVADFNRRNFSLGNVKTVRSIEVKQFSSRKVNQGDILLERSGGGEKSPVGCAVQVRESLQNLVSSNFVSRIRAVDDVDSEYLSLVLAALYSNGLQTPHSSQTTGIQNLDTESYFQIRVPKRSTEDQLKCVALGREVIDGSTEMVSEIERFINLTEEFKSSLITAAITGQFEVTTERRGA
jgi:type I restriction enzyme S subunit